MVYTFSDLKHLDLMTSLPHKKSPEDIARNLMDRYSSPQIAHEMASYFRMEHDAFGSKPDKEKHRFWGQVLDAVEVLTPKYKRSFDENILALCSLLNANGQEKYASNLGQRFVDYKQANALEKQATNLHMYRTHDEDGEDLVDRAHPDGDKTMGEASDALADVETIVSQHKKIVDVMHKTPTGKLASYVQQCKVVLAQEIEETPATGADKITDARNKAKQVADRAIKNCDILLQQLHPNILNTRYAAAIGMIGHSFKPLRDLLDIFKEEFKSAKEAVEKNTSITTLEAIKFLLDKIIILIGKVEFNSDADENTKTRNTYIVWFQYLLNAMWSAEELVRGNQEAASYHINHLPSDWIGGIFKEAASKIQTEILDKVQSTPNTVQILMVAERQRNEYNAIANKLVALKKTMPVSEVMKLPEWQSATFSKGESVTTIAALRAMLKKDHDTILNAAIRAQQVKG
jgi:hypothetical protein